MVEWAAGSIEVSGIGVGLGPVPACLGLLAVVVGLLAVVVGLLGMVVGVVDGETRPWPLPALCLHLQDAPGTVLHLGALVMEEQAAGTDCTHTEDTGKRDCHSA